MSGALLMMASGGGMRASVSPELVIRSGSGTVTTPPMTANVFGGVPPYTYLWDTLGVDEINPTSPMTQSTAFRRFDVSPGVSYAAMVYMTATDSVGNTASATGSAEINGFG